MATRLLIRIDRAADRFLLDHQVAGRAILPTAMGLDLLIRASRRSPEGGEAFVVEDVEVGPPVIVGAGTVALLASADRIETGGWAGSLTSAAGHEPHLTARVRTIIERPPRHAPSLVADDRGVDADLIYPPFFHGPAFRVVSRFASVDTGFVVRLNEALPDLLWSSGPLQTRPRLLELVMQGCGLAAFADSGRLMIPSRIARLTWFRAALRPSSGKDAPATAWITDRGDDTYDGYVVDAGGETLLDVVGYRSTDLGPPPDLAAASAFRQQLSPTEGVRR